MGMLYDEAYIEHRKLEYYADKLNITTKYLSGVSRTFTGRGASYWINRFTTTKICILLKFSRMSLSEIADKFRFSSVNVLFSALTRTSISSTFVASNLKFQDHAKERSELSGGVRPLPTLQ